MSALKPNLLRGYREGEGVEVLDIPALEWAGRGRWEERGCDLYEFIGRHDALMALGVAEPHMLDVGRSGKKFGPGFETKSLANDRFRLELQTNDLDIDAVMDRAKTIGLDTFPAKALHDPMSLSLQEVAALVKRYPTKLRDQLYKGLLESGGNGWQLLESFPWLAVRIFVMEDSAAKSARHLVERGAKQRDIAEALNVPMSFKRFFQKPTVPLMDLADLLSRHPDVVSHHCPEKQKKQYTWLSFIAKAYESGNEDFAIWVAIHWQSLSYGISTYWQRRNAEDLNDWVRDCSIEQVSRNIHVDDVDKIYQAMLTTSAEAAKSLQAWWQGIHGATAVGRLFNKEMSPQTVIRLSEEWHERAAVTAAADVEFPDPWYKGGNVNGYRIEPITSSPDLSRYAHRLHNCATSYAHRIADGCCFLYVVLQEDIPKAMVELTRPAARTIISQLTGPRNAFVSDELDAAVNTWLKAA